MHAMIAGTLMMYAYCYLLTSVVLFIFSIRDAFTFKTKYYECVIMNLN
jgi:hypothetical protein